MILKVFTQPNCPKCPAAKALVRQLMTSSSQLKVEEYDVATVDGLAEASFYAVLATPSLILCDLRGQEVSGWRGEVPTIENLKLKMQNAK